MTPPRTSSKGQNNGINRLNPPLTSTDIRNPLTASLIVRLPATLAISFLVWEQIITNVEKYHRRLEGKRSLDPYIYFHRYLREKTVPFVYQGTAYKLPIAGIITPATEILVSAYESGIDEAEPGLYGWLEGSVEYMGNVHGIFQLQNEGRSLALEASAHYKMLLVATNEVDDLHQVLRQYPKDTREHAKLSEHLEARKQDLDRLRGAVAITKQIRQTLHHDPDNLRADDKCWEMPDEDDTRERRKLYREICSRFDEQERWEVKTQTGLQRGLRWDSNEKLKGDLIRWSGIADEDVEDGAKDLITENLRGDMVVNYRGPERGRT